MDGELNKTEENLPVAANETASAEAPRRVYCTGVYPHLVDDKYRIKIPVEARALINGPFRLSRATSKRAIAVHTLEDSEKIFAKLEADMKALQNPKMEAPFDKGKALNSLRVLYSSFTKPIEEDAQGRFVLPQSLMTWAGITKKSSLYTVGVGAHFEIWDAASYDAAMNDDDYVAGLEAAGIFDIGNAI